MYYPLQAEYERIAESDERCVELEKLDACHHKSMLSIEKLLLNPLLAANVLSEEKYEMYQGYIDTEKFDPSLFRSFPIRTRLVKLIVRNEPASIKCTDWQDSLLDGLEGEEKVRMIAEAWDVIDFKKLIRMLYEIDELERWIPFMELPAIPPCAWNLGFLRLLHLVNAFKWYNCSKDIQGKALHIVELIKRGIKRLNSIRPFADKDTSLEQWLNCERRKGQKCYSSWMKMIKMAQDAAHSYPVLAGNQIAALVKLAFYIKANDAPMLKFNCKWALRGLDMDSLYPAVASELKALISDKPSKPDMSLEKWLFSTRLVLDRRNRALQVTLLPESVFPFEELITIINSWADRVVLNLKFLVPVRINKVFPLTLFFQDLVVQAMSFLQKSTLLFKENLGQRCWRGNPNLAHLDAYAMGIPYLLSRGVRMDTSMFLPAGSWKRPVANTVSTTVAMKMCPTPNIHMSSWITDALLRTLNVMLDNFSLKQLIEALNYTSE
jgi:hypothetical protein